MRNAPGYWMHETTGVLRPAVEAYLHGGVMTADQIGAIRAYFRQWVGAPIWRGPAPRRLLAAIDAINTRARISAWLDDALAAGFDPL